MPQLENRTVLDPTYVVKIDGKPIPEDLAARLISWEYEDYEKMDKLVLTFDNYDLKITDDPRLTLGAVIEFRHGYTKELSDWKWFTIGTPSGFRERRFECLEVIHVFATEEKYRSWIDSALEPVVADIAKDNGLKYEFEELYATDGRIPKFDYVQPKVHDMAFLYMLGQKIGYELWVEYDTLYFMPRMYWQEPYLSITFEGLTGQVLDFKPTEHSMNRRGKFSGGGIDLEKKSAFFLTENGTTKKATYLDGKFHDFEKIRGQYKDLPGAKIVRIPMRNRDEADAILQGRYIKEMEDQITAELHLVGEPKLKARRVIIMENVGKYSGRYYVRSVKHSISGGYVSVADLTRNAAFDAGEKYSLDNILTLVNKNRLSVKEFLAQTKDSPKGQHYARLFKR